MSKGLNSQFISNAQGLLESNVFSTIYLSSVNVCKQLRTGAGPFEFNLEWDGSSSKWVGIHVVSKSRTGVFQTPLKAYWLPQGGYVDLPIKSPAANFVFTSELTGCAIYVDQFDAHTYRAYHIEVPKKADQYDSQSHGKGLVDSFTWAEYGLENNIDRTRATALLHFNANKQWALLGQVINGRPQGFSNGKAIDVGAQSVQKLYNKVLGL